MILRPLLDSMGIFLGEDSPLDIPLIAHNLAHINRFNGRVGTYTVAQHCVEVAKHLPNDLKLSGLLHDAAEAYLGDVISPIKKLIPKYGEVENAVLDAIDSHFSVDTRHKDIVEVDRRMVITEAMSFGIWNSEFPGQACYVTWGFLPSPDCDGYAVRVSTPVKICKLNAKVSEAQFLEAFETYSS